MPAESLSINGRVLYLYEDASLIVRQLSGENLTFEAERPLLDFISTDEITPAWACYYYDRTLGRFALVGLRGNVVGVDSIKRGGFEVLVCGRSKGCGSSRETAPFAELAAGIRLVVARSFEPIYLQNCQNIGLYTTTDFGVLRDIEESGSVSLDILCAGLDDTTTTIVRSGGLLQCGRERQRRSRTLTVPGVLNRPQTMVEKIVSRHVALDRSAHESSASAHVRPGDCRFVRADVRFTHDYTTAMTDALFREAFGEDARLAHPESVYVFRDHLTFVDHVLTEQQRRSGLAERAHDLYRVQLDFVARHGIRHFAEISAHAGSEAICHNQVLEEIAMPGQIVVGTDSHTATAGAVGCLAFGVGSTEMANAWFTEDVRLTVPESIRVRLTGSIRDGVCAKDVMLHLFASELVQSGSALGRAFEIGGPGLRGLCLDERATLTNMSVEAGALTAVCEVDDVVLDYLSERRGMSREALGANVVHPDPAASYAGDVELCLDDVEPMIALPGDPRKAVALSQVLRTSHAVPIDIAYGGSCTGGKAKDMDYYAFMAKRALELGLRVPANVRFYIQFGSQSVRRYAEARGYSALFEAVGAELLGPSCGACIRAGKGVSTRVDEVTVSAINRNFPGRSGPGQVYLASPLVVAASAVLGRLAHPGALSAMAGGERP